jgi:hypothetical protein
MSCTVAGENRIVHFVHDLDLEIYSFIIWDHPPTKEDHIRLCNLFNAESQPGIPRRIFQGLFFNQKEDIQELREPYPGMT